MRRPAKRIIHAAAQEVHAGLGCSDHNCVFGHPGGMGTNGRCQCMKTHDIDEMRRHARTLAAVARKLAERVAELEEAIGGER